MKPRVVASLNDATGTRCVDIRADGAGFDWVECRRDPEDGHGWRHTGAGEAGFPTEAAARDAAAASVGWL
ncbi:hypothetical protein HKCCE3408_18840 [Rhodobacterales bacterium HKCCE3408]|nr:hypothetical protein [Rhodobacterales bacterium HKCCE3408]